MRDCGALFHASPDVFFTRLEAKIRDMAQDIASIAARVDALAQLYHEILKAWLPIASIMRPGWAHDARDPAPAFGNLFEPEIKGGAWKCWAKAAGMLRAHLLLPRHQAQVSEIQVADLCSEAARESFHLKIDGAPVPWDTTGGRHFGATVPAQA